MLTTLALTAFAAAPGAGELIITELVIAPSTDTREWFEVHNPTSSTWDLDGCVLSEGGKDSSTNEHTVSGTVEIAPGSYAVLGYRPGTDSTDYCVEVDAHGGCITQPVYYYPSLQFNNSSEETLSITCGKTLVDAAPYDWDIFDGDCYAESCTVSLAPDELDDDANDSLDAWCIASPDDLYLDQAGTEANGTPAGANTCFETGPLCGAGQVIFSELMADPPGSADEWIELAGLGDSCNLAGCYLAIGECADGTDEACVSDEKLIEGAQLDIADGDHFVFSRGELAYTGAVGSYSGLSQSNSEERWLHLLCDGGVVDTAPLDWAQFDDRCGDDVNCSAQLSPAAYDPTENDDLAMWCLAGADSEISDDDGNPVRATPSALNACASYASPGAGDVVFTELMANPAGLAEWLEITNVSTDTFELGGCDLWVYDDDDDGVPAPDDADVTPLGDLSLEPDQSLVVTDGGCLFGEERGLDTGSPVVCTGDELPAGISLPNTGKRYVALVCIDAETGLGQVEVDAMTYDLDAQGVRQGHSLIFDLEGSSDPALDNDDHGAWCEAGFSQEFAKGDDEAEDCNYGSPGSTEACVPFDANVTGGPGCRCTTGSASGAAGFLALLVGLAVRRRRG